MRFKPTYKSYKTIKNSISCFPVRILKFKKSKWKKTISSYKSQFKSINNKTVLVNKIRFINVLRIVNSFKKWNKIRSVFKSGLSIKASLCNFFENSISIKFFKRNLIFQNTVILKDIFLKNVIYPNYRLDILLSKLRFFVTAFQSCQYINNSIVLVNDTKPRASRFLIKKDVISFRKLTSYDLFKFAYTIKSLSSNNQFFSFCEFCPYTKTIVIIKDIESLSEFDLMLLSSNFFDYKKFLTYISK